MKNPYSLSEDELNRLQRSYETIQLVSILFGEVQRASTFTPQMTASLLELVGDDMGCVLDSIKSSFSTR
jgi:hypothetical protein